MKRKLPIVLCIVILILIGAGVVFSVMISSPAYKPGVLSERNDLEKFTTPPRRAQKRDTGELTTELIYTISRKEGNEGMSRRRGSVW